MAKNPQDLIDEWFADDPGGLWLVEGDNPILILEHDPLPSPPNPDPVPSNGAQSDNEGGGSAV